MSVLYSKKRSENMNEQYFSSSFKINEFTPTMLKLYLKGEEKAFKKTFVRIYFQLMTLGKARLVYAVNETGEAIHTSYVVPKCFKFSFMNKNDYIIGPCYTNPDYRGLGIYPNVLRYITSKTGNCNTIFYMSVDESNLPSIKGIEKAGFDLVGKINKTRVLKRYYLNNKGEK